MDHLQFRVLCTDYSGRVSNYKKAVPIVEENGNEIRVTFKKEDFYSRGYFNHHLQYIRFECNLLCAKAGDPGYMFYQNGFGEGFVKTNFTERANCETRTWISCMPVCGICENPNAVFFRMDGMAADTCFYVEVRENVYRIYPQIQLDCDDPYEDISMVFYKMPNASYVDMARFYRQYQLEEKGCAALRDRVKNRPKLKDAADAIKKAYDEYEKYKYLQYEFMENHEKLAEGVYRSTFSDGTTVTVNYNDETYSVVKDGKTI